MKKNEFKNILLYTLFVFLVFMVPNIRVNAAYKEWSAEYQNSDGEKLTLSCTVTPERTEYGCAGGRCYRNEQKFTCTVSNDSGGSARSQINGELKESTSNDVLIQSFDLKKEKLSLKKVYDNTKGTYKIIEESIKGGSSFKAFSCKFYLETNQNQYFTASVGTDGRLQFSTTDGVNFISREGSIGITANDLYYKYLSVYKCPKFAAIGTKPSWGYRLDFGFSDQDITFESMKEYDKYVLNLDEVNDRLDEIKKESEDALNKCVVKNNIDRENICEKDLADYKNTVDNKTYNENKDSHYKNCLNEKFASEIEKYCATEFKMYDDVTNSYSDMNTVPPTLNVTFGEFSCDDLKDITDFIAVIYKMATIFLIVWGILASMADYGKVVMSGDQDAMKKANKRLVNRMIILAIFIFLPLLIDMITKLFLSSIPGFENIDSCMSGLL